MPKIIDVRSAPGTQGNQSVATVEDGQNTITLRGPAWEGMYANKQPEYVNYPHSQSYLDASGVRVMPLWWG